VSAPIVQSTGRRKRAVARVRFRDGSGVITVNNKAFDVYFPSDTHRMQAEEALVVLEKKDQYDVEVTLHGGGPSGQAGAMRLGVARALVELDPEVRPTLRSAGLLTRDDRKKERKKYGLKKARKAPQYSKR
jgi:small subunit ribosomal protein S9